jgi:hypothetical protein
MDAMTTTGKAPLDNRVEKTAAQRAERFAEIERQRGDTIGRKEMVMTRNARAETTGQRVREFVRMEREAG